MNRLLDMNEVCFGGPYMGHHRYHLHGGYVVEFKTHERRLPERMTGAELLEAVNRGLAGQGRPALKEMKVGRLGLCQAADVV